MRSAVTVSLVKQNAAALFQERGLCGNEPISRSVTQVLAAEPELPILPTMAWGKQQY